MSVRDVIKTAISHEVYFYLKDGRLAYKAKKGALPDDLKQKIVEYKEQLIDYLNDKDKRNSAKSMQEIAAVSRSEPIPLSFAQQRLWFIDQLETNTSRYNLTGQFFIDGELDLDALNAALTSLIVRHEVLRTVFETKENEPVQLIKDTFETPLKYFDFETLTEHNKIKNIESILKKSAERTFDLTKDILIDFTVIKLNADKFVIFYVMHHIVSDGWSRSIIQKEISLFYNAFLRGVEADLPELKVQYADYAYWQRETISGVVLKDGMEYWENHLANIPQVHNLPLDKVRPAKPSFSGKTHRAFLSSEISESINLYNKKYGTTIFMFMHSALALLFSRYSGEKDIVIGSASSGRNQKSLEGLVGFFINDIVIRTIVDENITFREFLLKNKQTVLDAYGQQHIPFEMLVERLNPHRSASYSPLYQIKLDVQNNVQSSLDLLNLDLVDSRRKSRESNKGNDPSTEVTHNIKHDLYISVAEDKGKICITWRYSTDIFNAQTIDRFNTYLENILEDIFKDESKSICHLNMMSNSEKKQLLSMHSAPLATPLKNTNIVSRFEESALEYPDAIAINDTVDTLTYKELNRYCNQVTSFILKLELSKNSKVAVCMERASEMFVGLLAIMKSGHAYVPIDPHMPQQRISAILNDCECKLVLTQTALMEEIDFESCKVLPLDSKSVAGMLNSYSDSNTSNHIDPEDTAYVIYTSGTSGIPKGVMVKHSALNSYCDEAIQQYYFSHLEGSLVLTGYHFDLTLPSFFLPLINGGSVRLLSVGNEIEELAQRLSRLEKPNLVRLTPSHLNLLLNEYRNAETHKIVDTNHCFVIGGEALDYSSVFKLRNIFPMADVYNHYGPTEAVIGSSIYPLTGERKEHSVYCPIGSPMANKPVLVLDTNMQLCAPGIIGELYIGGKNLSSGYLNDEKLTSRKFIINPFDDTGSSLLYRSGDLVRWIQLDKKQELILEFYGRADSQVKLRGLRIELGDIENYLNAQSAIEKAAVSVFNVTGSDKKLVAYICLANKDLLHVDEEGELIRQKESLIRGMKENLSVSIPEYMIPQVFIFVEDFSLTKSGKLDRRNLPAPTEADLIKTEYVEPTSEIELAMCNAWETVLELQQVGLKDDFFMIGGHSLLATKLVNLVRTNLGAEIPLRAIFENSTVIELCQYIENNVLNKTMYDIPIVAKRDSLTLSYAQQRLWFIDQLGEGSAHYNVTGKILIEEDVCKEVLLKSFKLLVDRHEILRTNIVERDEEVYQIVQENFNIESTTIDFSRLSPGDLKLALFEFFKSESKSSFDLRLDLMIRFTLIELPRKRNLVVYTMHHIASDGWSRAILEKELLEIYFSCQKQTELNLPKLRVQYADYASWQKQSSKDPGFVKQLNYWNTHLNNIPKVHSMPLDYPRAEKQSFTGKKLHQLINPELKQEMRAFCDDYDVTLFMLIHTIYAVLLSYYSQNERILIGTPISGRVHKDLENLIGMFVNTLVLKADITPKQSFTEILLENKTNILDAYDNQDVPFEMLVEQLCEERDLSYNPIYQFMLVFPNSQSREQGLASEANSVIESSDVNYDESESTVLRTDIDLYVSTTESGINLTFKYDDKLFDSATIELMARQFVTLTKAIVDNPNGKLDDLHFDRQEHVSILAKNKPFDDVFEGELVLSYHQQRLWFIQSFEKGVVYEGGPSYHNIPLLLHIDGDIDAELLESSVNEVLGRFSLARRNYFEVDSRLESSVLESLRLSIKRENLTSNKFSKNEAIEYAVNISKLPFNFNNTPLVRASLIQYSPKNHIFMLVVHHMIADRPSVKIISERICETYKRKSLNEPEEILSIDDLSEKVGKKENEISKNKSDYLPHLVYWRSKLGRGIKALELPQDYPRMHIHEYVEERFHTKIDKNLASRIEALAKRMNVTEHVLLLAAFKSLLYKYAQHDEIVVGTVIDNRAKVDGLEALGMFQNYLAIRDSIYDKDSFIAVVDKVNASYQQALRYSDIPLDLLSQHLNLDVDMSRTVLFDVLFQFEEEAAPVVSLDETVFNCIDTNLGFGKYDLNVLVKKKMDCYSLDVVYNNRFYRAGTVSQMFRHLESLLLAISENERVIVSDVELLNKEDKKQQLEDWNAISDSPTQSITIHRAFESCVLNNPESVALVYDRETLTYSELNRRANRVAHELVSKGVVANTKVGLYIDRSIEMVIGIIAILKSGGAYVPIDPSLPSKRVSFILEDSKLGLVLTRESFFSKLNECCAEENIEYVCIQQLNRFRDKGTKTKDHQESNLELKEAVTPESLAYVIYTSGSSGNPKGVLVEHKNITSLFHSSNKYFDFTSSDVWTMFHSFSFDFSVWELWGSLINSAKLVLVPQTTAQSPEDFYKLVLLQNVTVLNQTPSMFREVIGVDLELQHPLALNYVIFGGEALDFAMLNSWFSRHGEDSPKLINMYGITETTVHVTYHRILKDETTGAVFSSIGKKLPHLELYILGEHKELMPVGIAGELYVGGEGLARGYLNRKELNKQHFITHPFKANQRLYKTGDLGRYFSDGNIQYLGRKDQQVKIRGFRIELGEIEAVLEGHINIKTAVVLVNGSHENGEVIIAYIVLNDDAKKHYGKSEDSILELTQDVLKRAQSHLPKYMLPANIIVIDKLPLTTNGKLDKSALPKPEQRTIGAAQFEAPSNVIELKLCEIWKTTLKLKDVGVNDNFFSLGGHSLLATRLVSAIRQQFVIEMPIRILFEYPTVKDLALHVKTVSNTNVLPPVSRVSRDEKLPLSYAQQRLWFIDRLGEGSVEYNMPGYFLHTGEFNKSAFYAAVESLIKRHEVLRTNFIVEKEEPFQVINNDYKLPLEFIDLCHEENIFKREKVAAIFNEQSNTRFCLDKDLKIRVCIIKLEEDQHLIHYTMHHIAGDGWSIKIFKDELSQLYTDFANGNNNTLPPLAVQYADYAVWQRQWLSGENLDKQVNYWRNQLAGIPAVHDLPLDKPRPPKQKYDGKAFTQLFDEKLTRAIYEICKKQKISLFIFLETVFALLVSRYSSQNDVVIGSPIAGRTHADLDSLIGFFVNSLVIRTHISNDIDFKELLSINKSTIFDAYENQHVPFEMLVEEIRPERDLSYNSLFQILFVVQNMEKSEGTTEGQVDMTDNDSLFNERSVRVRFDLALHVTEESETLKIRWSYRDYLFNESSIKRMANSFNVLLESVVSEFSKAKGFSPVSKLNIMPDNESVLLEKTLNNTYREFQKDICFHELFELKVREVPDNTAIIFKEESLSYLKFNQLSNLLAKHIRSLGVSKDTIVAINLNRSIEAMIALMGVLKSGAGYVPLEPDLPTSRMSYILNDSEAKLVITDRKYENSSVFEDKEVIVLDKEFIASLQSRYDHENLERIETRLSSDALAYVIYTSGTTGQPKGVMIDHSSLMNFLLGVKDTFLVNNVVGSIVSSSLTFDATVQSLYLPLLDGLSVELLPDDEQLIENLAEYFVDDEEAYLFKITPTHLKALENQASIVANPMAKHVVVVAGETLTRDTLFPWFDKLLPNATFINEYGPTEGTVGSCIYTIKDLALFEKGQSIPIGNPLPNIEFYVFDTNMNLTPFGAIGELYIGGKGLAREYLNQDSLTSRKFISHCFSNGETKRLYRTGDHVRWIENHGLEFIGRLDDQIKIRGYRIELPEIESVIASLDYIRDAVVLTNGSNDDISLVAYMAPSKEFLNKASVDHNEKHVEQWTYVNDDKYGDESNHVEDVVLNFHGWNSSYTNLPIPKEQMEQWVEYTFSRISRLSPKNLFEIGCGQGLFLYRYAESCEQVYATDISRIALNGIQSEIERRNWSNVFIEQGDALHFSHLESKSVDTIVINSVAQYFPNKDYLDQVVTRALDCLSEGGKIFIGDVRNLDLLESHLCTVERSQTSQSMTAGTLSSRIQRRKIQESELLISPSYFANLSGLNSNVASADIIVKRGLGDNEMLRYRYDVIITKGKSVELDKETASLQQDMNWVKFEGFNRLRDILSSRQEVTFGIFGIPNYRVTDDYQLSVKIKAWNKSRAILPQQKNGHLDEANLDKITELESILAFAESLGYQCELTWSQDELDTLDVIFSLTEMPEIKARSRYSKKQLVNYPQLPTMASDIASEVRKSLNEKLPEYMIPSVFICMEDMPLTVSGKIDKKSLPIPEESDREQNIYQAPTNSIQEKLCEIWGELLSLSKVGINDNFFSLGGHSLLATRLISMIRESFRVEIPLRILFESPSVIEIAKLIEQESSDLILPDIEVVDKSQPLPLSFSQQRLWVIEQFNRFSVQYNMPARYLVKGHFDVEAFKQALECIIERHQVLRTCFVESEHEPVQLIQEEYEIPFSFIDVSDSDKSEIELSLSQIIESENNTHFDLTKDLMIRVKVIKLDSESHLILYTLHHIASDGWSVGIFRNEISQLYAAFVNSKDNPLPPLSIQYADFAIWQKQWLKGEVLQKGLNYWCNQLDAIPEKHSLPLDYQRPAQQTFSGRVYRQQIDNALSEKIEQVCQKYEVTLFMLLETALAVLVSRFSNKSDIVIGTPIAGRNHSNLESLIGFFVNTLVIRTRIPTDSSFLALLKQNKETILDAYSFQHIPFEMLVDELHPKRSLSFNPLIQILFAVQNNQRGYLNFQNSNEMSAGSDKAGKIKEITNIKFDLEVNVHEQKNGLTVSWGYNTSLFSQYSINNLSESYVNLLDNVVESLLFGISEKPVNSNSSFEPKRYLSILEENQIPLIRREAIGVAGEVLHQNYAREELSNDLPDLNLPTDFNREELQAYKEAECSTLINRKLAIRLQALSRRQNVDYGVLLLACFSLLLSRYANAEKVLIGTDTADAKQASKDNYFDSHVFLIDVGSSLTLEQLLKSTAGAILSSKKKQDLLLPKLLEIVNPICSAAKAPIHQVSFNLKKQAPRKQKGEARASEGTYSFDDYNRTLSKVFCAKTDLDLEIAENLKGTLCTIKYNKQLFSQKTIEKMLIRYAGILKAILDGPEQVISELQLPESNINRINMSSHLYGSAIKPYVKDVNGSKSKSLLDLFEKEIVSNYDKIIAKHHEENIYAQDLNIGANSIMSLIRKHNIEDNQVVAICIDPSLELLATLLASLREGVSFIFISDQTPRLKVLRLLEKYQIGTVLYSQSHTQSDLIFKLQQGSADLRLINVDHAKKCNQQTTENLAGIDTNKRAFIFIPSKDSGEDYNGIDISHKCIIDLVFSNYSLDTLNCRQERERTRVFGSIDVIDCIVSMARGEVLNLGKSYASSDRELIANNSKPSKNERLLDSFVNRCLFSSHFSIASNLNNSNIEESTVRTRADALLLKRDSNLPCYILNIDGCQVPNGGIGRLYISIDLLSVCFTNKPGLTASRFIPDEFTENNGKRLYDTGFTARLLVGGVIEIIDDAVVTANYSANGLESLLLRDDSIENALVKTQVKQKRAQHIGYLKLNYATESKEDRANINEYISEFIRNQAQLVPIPNKIFEVKEFEYQEDGRINFEHLAQAYLDSSRTEKFVEPCNAQEELLCTIWRDALNAKRVGINDNFFELGGNSLIATRVISQIRKEFKTEIEIKALFELPTIALLSQEITNCSERGVLPEIDKAERLTGGTTEFEEIEF